ncbi:uncharacterized protein LOC112043626 isoform X2 [Bicyclus anynana]|uniref:Uncharacterized protein LOC112043626 isoform X2 n=1 Tax=Bicyclus anynana TaxID=110368 RepID=A0A6J1MHY2_BICAN|nr:uncharacterized protein LOC112043626 isoform X2 [Bicyclus anynana]
MLAFDYYAVAFTLAFSFVVQLEAVTVDPLAPMCPTNKIAPRRKRYDSHPRTFGEFYNLLTPNSPNGLQEKPVDDAPDDCVTPSPIRRQGNQRTHFNAIKKRPSNQHHLLNQHNQHGIKPSTRPTRPPPAGYFGTNTYTPPKPLKPTANVKPVAEPSDDLQVIYRPGNIVGGPSNHIIGLPQKQGRPRPNTTTTTDATSTYREPKRHHNYYYPSAVQSNGNRYNRPRKYNGDTGIVGSFVDLFF